MFGWTGNFLRVDLSAGHVYVQRYDGNLARRYVGGRGYSIKILWDEVPPGANPLGPENRLVLSIGPLTGIPGPSTGKLVVAAKSPLTYGYGDGNVGTRAAVMLKRAGYDAIIISGISKKPVYIYIEDGKTEILDAEDLWGLDTFRTEKVLAKRHGADTGILSIGPAGENKVKYATVMSQEGRSGGRTGMGAVMGSKRLKAIVIRGTREASIANPEEYRKVASEAYRDVRSRPGYSFWRRQGTMAAIQWSQENSVLPVRNFSEGIFEEAENIDGFAMEKIKVGQRGCPLCNAICGNIVGDSEDMIAELDYENVALLGSNLGIGDLRKIATLNRLADMWGIDTIGLGVAIGFAMEASERGLIKDKIEWGDFEAARDLAENIVYRRSGLGKLLGESIAKVAETLGGESFAMHVKGLSITGYDCHAAPGMALSYAVSPIGAHHKDAWVISWEVKTDRLSYGKEKAEKVLELQRIRGGFFETLVACRLPWVEVGLDIEWYVKLFNLATGIKWSFSDHLKVAERILNHIRAYWVREHIAGGIGWNRDKDLPPRKWFEKPLTKGPYTGAKLDFNRFQGLLDSYYEIIGWDKRGIPRYSTLKRYDLLDVAQVLSKYVKLEP